MARIDCGTYSYNVSETAEEIDLRMLHAGRPTGFITVTLTQKDVEVRVNPAFVHVYHD